mmetsp:Transcript_8410/g.17114  ORF Transcript_8410/g.17114 Transcript_8410/m.17114 type:complete len:225 (-) Transcript_8410:13-687(-)
MAVGEVQTQAQVLRETISLKGSTDVVSEFFRFSVNSILFQRGIYPPETFTRVSKYGLTMLMSTDDGVKSYLDAVVSQLSHWLMSGEVERVVVVIKSVDSGRVLERWAFDIETDQSEMDDSPSTSRSLANREKPTTKSQRDIMMEIQAIIRQITASVTFLPLLDEPCKFDMLVYTHKDSDTPEQWEESHPHYIANPQNVRLRSFSTAYHQVDASVAYAVEDEDLI